MVSIQKSIFMELIVRHIIQARDIYLDLDPPDLDPPDLDHLDLDLLDLDLLDPDPPDLDHLDLDLDLRSQ
jgi:hypothetical protein